MEISNEDAHASTHTRTHTLSESSHFSLRGYAYKKMYHTKYKEGIGAIWRIHKVLIEKA